MGATSGCDLPVSVTISSLVQIMQADYGGEEADKASKAFVEATWETIHEIVTKGLPDEAWVERIEESAYEIALQAVRDFDLNAGCFFEWFRTEVLEMLRGLRKRCGLYVYGEWLTVIGHAGSPSAMRQITDANFWQDFVGEMTWEQHCVTELIGEFGGSFVHAAEIIGCTFDKALQIEAEARDIGARLAGHSLCRRTCECVLAAS